MKNMIKRMNTHLMVLAGLALVAASVQAQSLAVTNGLTLWLKADAITGMTNGQAISTWNDSSVNGNDATNPNAGRQPTYITGVLSNNLPVVRFDSPMPPDLGQYLRTPVMGALANASVFMFVRSVDYNNRYALAFGDDTHAMIEGFNPGVWEWFNSPRTTLTNVDIVNFKPVSFTEASTVAAPAGWVIGGSANTTQAPNGFPFKGDIAEVLVYDRSLSVSESQSVVSYLDAKWLAIPEPATMMMAGVGLALMAFLRRRRGVEWR